MSEASSFGFPERAQTRPPAHLNLLHPRGSKTLSGTLDQDPGTPQLAFAAAPAPWQLPSAAGHQVQPLLQTSEHPQYEEQEKEQTEECREMVLMQNMARGSIASSSGMRYSQSSSGFPLSADGGAYATAGLSRSGGGEGILLRSSTAGQHFGNSAEDEVQQSMTQAHLSPLEAVLWQQRQVYVSLLGRSLAALTSLEGDVGSLLGQLQQQACDSTQQQQQRREQEQEQEEQQWVPEELPQQGRGQSQGGQRGLQQQEEGRTATTGQKVLFSSTQDAELKQQQQQRLLRRPASSPGCLQLDRLEAEAVGITPLNWSRTSAAGVGAVGREVGGGGETQATLKAARRLPLATVSVTGAGEGELVLASSPSKEAAAAGVSTAGTAAAARRQGMSYSITATTTLAQDSRGNGKAAALELVELLQQLPSLPPAAAGRVAGRPRSSTLSSDGGADAFEAQLRAVEEGASGRRLSEEGQILHDLRYGLIEIVSDASSPEVQSPASAEEAGQQQEQQQQQHAVLQEQQPMQQEQQQLLLSADGGHVEQWEEEQVAVGFRTGQCQKGGVHSAAKAGEEHQRQQERVEVGQQLPTQQQKQQQQDREEAEEGEQVGKDASRQQQQVHESDGTDDGQAQQSRQRSVSSKTDASAIGSMPASREGSGGGAAAEKSPAVFVRFRVPSIVTNVAEELVPAAAAIAAAGDRSDVVDVGSGSLHGGGSKQGTIAADGFSSTVSESAAAAAAATAGSAPTAAAGAVLSSEPSSDDFEAQLMRADLAAAAGTEAAGTAQGHEEEGQQLGQEERWREEEEGFSRGGLEQEQQAAIMVGEHKQHRGHNERSEAGGLPLQLKLQQQQQQQQLGDQEEEEGHRGVMFVGGGRSDDGVGVDSDSEDFEAMLRGQEVAARGAREGGVEEQWWEEDDGVQRMQTVEHGEQKVCSSLAEVSKSLAKQQGKQEQTGGELGEGEPEGLGFGQRKELAKPGGVPISQGQAEVQGGDIVGGLKMAVGSSGSEDDFEAMLRGKEVAGRAGRPAREEDHWWEEGGQPEDLGEDADMNEGQQQQHGKQQEAEQHRAEGSVEDCDAFEAMLLGQETAARGGRKVDEAERYWETPGAGNGPEEQGGEGWDPNQSVEIGVGIVLDGSMQPVYQTPQSRDANSQERLLQPNAGNAAATAPGGVGRRVLALEESGRGETAEPWAAAAGGGVGEQQEEQDVGRGGGMLQFGRLGSIGAISGLQESFGGVAGVGAIGYGFPADALADGQSADGAWSAYDNQQRVGAGEEHWQQQQQQQQVKVEVKEQQQRNLTAAAPAAPGVGNIDKHGNRDRLGLRLQHAPAVLGTTVNVAMLGRAKRVTADSVKAPCSTVQVAVSNTVAAALPPVAAAAAAAAAAGDGVAGAAEDGDMVDDFEAELLGMEAASRAACGTHAKAEERWWEDEQQPEELPARINKMVDISLGVGAGEVGEKGAGREGETVQQQNENTASSIGAGSQDGTWQQNKQGWHQQQEKHTEQIGRSPVAAAAPVNSSSPYAGVAGDKTEVTAIDPRHEKSLPSYIKYHNGGAPSSSRMSSCQEDAASASAAALGASPAAAEALKPTLGARGAVMPTQQGAAHQADGWLGNSLALCSSDGSDKGEVACTGQQPQQQQHQHWKVQQKEQPISPQSQQQQELCEGASFGGQLSLDASVPVDCRERSSYGSVEPPVAAGLAATPGSAAAAAADQEGVCTGTLLQYSDSHLASGGHVSSHRRTVNSEEHVQPVGSEHTNGLAPAVLTTAAEVGAAEAQAPGVASIGGEVTASLWTAAAGAATAPAAGGAGVGALAAAAPAPAGGATAAGGGRGGHSTGPGGGAAIRAAEAGQRAAGISVGAAGEAEAAPGEAQELSHVLQLLAEARACAARAQALEQQHQQVLLAAKAAAADAAADVAAIASGAGRGGNGLQSLRASGSASGEDKGSWLWAGAFTAEKSLATTAAAANGGTWAGDGVSGSGERASEYCRTTSSIGVQGSGRGSGDGGYGKRSLEYAEALSVAAAKLACKALAARDQAQALVQQANAGLQAVHGGSSSGGVWPGGVCSVIGMRQSYGGYVKQDSRGSAGTAGRAADPAGAAAVDGGGGGGAAGSSYAGKAADANACGARSMEGSRLDIAPAAVGAIASRSTSGAEPRQPKGACQAQGPGAAGICSIGSGANHASGLRGSRENITSGNGQGWFVGDGAHIMEGAVKDAMPKQELLQQQQRRQPWLQPGVISQQQLQQQSQEGGRGQYNFSKAGKQRSKRTSQVSSSQCVTGSHCDWAWQPASPSGDPIDLEKHTDNRENATRGHCILEDAEEESDLDYVDTGSELDSSSAGTISCMEAVAPGGSCGLSIMSWSAHGMKGSRTSATAAYRNTAQPSATAGVRPHGSFSLGRHSLGGAASASDRIPSLLHDAHQKLLALEKKAAKGRTAEKHLQQTVTMQQQQQQQQGRSPGRLAESSGDYILTGSLRSRTYKNSSLDLPFGDVDLYRPSSSPYKGGHCAQYSMQGRRSRARPSTGAAVVPAPGASCNTSTAHPCCCTASTNSMSYWTGSPGMIPSYATSAAAEPWHGSRAPNTPATPRLSEHIRTRATVGGGFGASTQSNISCCQQQQQQQGYRAHAALPLQPNVNMYGTSLGVGIGVTGYQRGVVALPVASGFRQSLEFPYSSPTRPVTSASRSSGSYAANRPCQGSSNFMSSGAFGGTTAAAGGACTSMSMQQASYDPALEALRRSLELVQQEREQLSFDQRELGARAVGAMLESDVIKQVLTGL